MSGRAHGTRAHGTRANYDAGCRCLRCRAANANYNSTRARATAYGRPTTDLVDAGPARTHVHRAGPPPRAGGVVTAPSRLDVHHLGDGLA